MVEMLYSSTFPRKCESKVFLGTSCFRAFSYAGQEEDIAVFM